MASLERRIEQLEAVLPPSVGERPPLVVKFHPWCSAGQHSLPRGYLRSLSGTQRHPGETEEEFTARAAAIERGKRPNSRCPVVLVEDREMLKCAEHGE